MHRTPREIAEQVRKMVAGEGVVLADLFADDGVMAYPFAPPGHPSELRGREAVRAFFAGRARHGSCSPWKGCKRRYGRPTTPR